MDDNNLIDKDLFEETQRRYDLELQRKESFLARTNCYFVVISFFFSTVIVLIGFGFFSLPTTLCFNFDMFLLTISIFLISVSIVSLTIFLLRIVGFHGGIYAKKPYKSLPLPDEILDWRKREIKKVKEILATEGKNFTDEEIWKELKLILKEKLWERYQDIIRWNFKINDFRGDESIKFGRSIYIAVILILLSILIQIIHKFLFNIGR